jgi:hypothetical protein
MDFAACRRRAAALRNWLLARPYTALAAACLAGLSVSFLRRTQTEWEDVFVRAARVLWAGGDLYAPGSAYTYPPFMAFAALPFAALPDRVGGVAWLLLNMVALVALVRWAWRLAGGAALEGGGRPAGWREHAAALLGLACGLPYLQNCLAHHQTDIVLGALVMGGCLLLARSRWYAGAGCLGLAAACKCTPLLFAPYLLWRGRRKAAVVLVAVAAGVNLLPELVSRPPSGTPRLAEFAARFLRPLARADHYVGTWASDVVYNQSLAGAGQRWLATSWSWAGGDCLVHPRPGVHPLALRAAVSGSALLLLAGSLWACGAPLRKVEARAGEAVPRLAWECGVVVLLMLLLSPMSSKAHFGVLVLPGFCLARARLSWGDWRRRWLLLPAVLLALLANKDPLGPGLYTLTLWYGSVTWQTVLLLLGCCLVLSRECGEPAGAPCPGVLLGAGRPAGRAA